MPLKTDRMAAPTAFAILERASTEIVSPPHSNLLINMVERTTLFRRPLIAHSCSLASGMDVLSEKLAML
jgi:hypothetical protein